MDRLVDVWPRGWIARRVWRARMRHASRTFETDTKDRIGLLLIGFSVGTLIGAAAVLDLIARYYECV